MQLLIGLIGGLMGSLVGGVLAWLTTRWTLRQELEHGYDKELRTERLTAYRKLWQLTGALPRYPWPANPTRSDLRNLIERCHSWYFEVGGLLFSQKTKDAYFEMMNSLDRAAGRQVSDDTRVVDEVFEDLFIAGERLRLHLAADIGTSLRPKVLSPQLRPAEAPE
ncbi:hypothetical protein AB0H92_32120 [Streptomyces phaeochromogenes]|uniref:hypothetical protein n=1 Tax=Streptomyces phaeochromogenes TaxID=1923 RepID=UPI0033E83FD8